MARSRTLVAQVPQEDGSTVEHRQETHEADAGRMIAFICGICDEHPGVEITFTATTTEQG